MRTHEVLIVPAFGHADAHGCYNQGLHIGAYSELDVIDAYLPNLVEELETDGIRYRVLPTRSRPGVPEDRRHLHVERFQLVLHLGVGVYAGRSPPAKNISAVYFGTPLAKDIAKEISEALCTWGQCYVWGHRNSRPEPLKTDPVINADDTLGVKIEPFMLNGPDAKEYLARLPELGTAIGRAVSSYLMVRGQARGRVAMSLDNRR